MLEVWRRSMTACQWNTKVWRTGHKFWHIVHVSCSAACLSEIILAYFVGHCPHNDNVRHYHKEMRRFLMVRYWFMCRWCWNKILRGYSYSLMISTLSLCTLCLSVVIRYAHFGSFVMISWMWILHYSHPHIATQCVNIQLSLLAESKLFSWKRFGKLLVL